jgi:phytoene dehydrogenase-like protein
VLTLLTRRGNESSAGGCRLPRGGLGAFSSALAAAARSAGVSIECDSPVAGILVENDAVCGVELHSGERIAAGRVVSSVDPRQTFLHLLGTAHLDTGFVRRVDHFRQRGITAKLHLALEGLPSFTGLSESEVGHRLLLAPSLDAIESAYNASKYGEVSARPVLEVLIPTVHDPSLAPQGHHVLSAVVSYAAYNTKADLATARAALLDSCLQALEQAAPGIRSQVRASELLLPKDLEQTNRCFGGHWHHGELAFDQFLMVRPFPGAAQYNTPVQGLFLCGAGSHPGGGLTGLPGRIAAERIQKAGTP